MYETTISLQAINDVKDFVNTVMLFNYDIDLVSGRTFFFFCQDGCFIFVIIV